MFIPNRPERSITLFRGFREDARTSMMIYADTFRQILLRDFGGIVKAEEYAPTMRRWPGKLRELGIRYARFISYPRQAASFADNIIHILEPGYAHVLRALNPDRAVVTVHDIIP